MNTGAEPRPALQERIAAGAAWFVIALGTLALARWCLKGLEWPMQERFFPGMMPLSGVCFVLTGTGLALLNKGSRARRSDALVKCFAAFAVFVGGMILFEYLAGVDLRVDRLLFHDAIARELAAKPGRPSVLGSINFVFLGFGLFFADSTSRSKQRAGELMTVLAMLICLLALIGYACGLGAFYGAWSSIRGPGMSLSVTVGFLTLGLGLLCARPERGLTQILASPTPSGAMARMLILAPVLIPLLTGWLQMIMWRSRTNNPDLAGWSFSLANILIFTLIIWWTARLLYRAEKVRLQAEHEIRQLNADLERRVSVRTAELSQALEALRESEERVRLVLDTALDAVVTVDERGGIISWNQEAETVFGWLRAEIMGKSLTETIIPRRNQESHDFVRTDFMPAADEQLKNRRFEIIALRRDGTEFPAEVAFTTVRLGSGSIFSAFIRDITQRKYVEEELRNSEQRFRELADAMPQIVWSARPDGYVDYYNNRWYDYTGFTRGEGGDESWAPLLHPDDLNKCMNTWYAAVRTSQPYQIEYRFMDRRTGSYRWHLGKALPIRDADGRITRWFGTCTDIDDQKRDQEEIQRLNATLERRVIERTSQLQEANKELEAFSYSISHDLRAPLRHIDGYLELIADEHGEALNDDAKRYLRRATDSAREMGLLIDDLLAFSRMARTEMSWSRIDMSALAAMVRQEMSAEIGGRNIDWEMEHLPVVNGDPSLLKQVWINLFSNAIKYTRPRDPASIKIGYTKTEKDHEFYIRDNGVGFDMRYVDKIFGVFQRLHHADQFEGTGIGLANVRRTILRHGGRVWAEGKLNAGATIHFTIPIKNGIHETSREN